MEMEAGSSFEGWAHIELYGHNREDGYVTTQYFGSACMFLVSVPEVPQHIEELKRPAWVGDMHMPAGTKVEYEAIPARKRYLGPGAIYALNPTTQEEVLRVISRNSTPKVALVVDLPPGGPQLNMPLPIEPAPEPTVTEEEHAEAAADMKEQADDEREDAETFADDDYPLF